MPELRKDPIVRRWVLLSDQRVHRPTDLLPERNEVKLSTNTGSCPFEWGAEAETPPEVYALRPGGGAPNGPGWRVRVVPNKFPALVADGLPERTREGVFEAMAGVGAHEVIVETPDHAASLATLAPEAFATVMAAYQERIQVHHRDPRVEAVLLFKNHGARAGASLAHPHSQLLALPLVPKTLQEELDGVMAYQREHAGLCVYCELLRAECTAQTRVVVENRAFVALAPFAPRLPFEVWVLPKMHAARFEAIDRGTFPALAEVVQGTLRRMAGVLRDPPYNLVLHTAPKILAADTDYHWHFEILPSTIFIGGFERGSDCYINAIAPEVAAQCLRSP